MVRRPSRYTGGEWNQVIKDRALVKTVLGYPDVYEVGMSNLGLRILYEIINADERFVAERVFSPWADMRERMEEEDLPLFSLETKTPVADFDIFGISLQSELTYTNVLGLLDAARVPRRSKDRTSIFPLVIAGGPCAFNPEPLSPFFDLFVVGEAEEAIVEILEIVADFKEKPVKQADAAAARRILLERLAAVEGIYVPAHGSEVPIKRRLITNFDKLAPPERPIVPFLETIHDRCVIEVTRGCGRGCRFCQAGIVYRPVRERTAAVVTGAVMTQAGRTGYDEVSLASLSTTDHSQIRSMLTDIAALPLNYVRAISLPSMRTDRFSVEIARMIAGRRKTGLTFAPEAGTARLRAVINKGLSEADILSAAGQAFAAGWTRLKLYFMIGLPGETDDDIAGIASLAEQVLRAAAEEMGPKQAKRVRIIVSASTFVPKPHTPFQWAPALPLAEIERRQKLLRSKLSQRQVEFKWHEAGSSIVEAALARGGPGMADVIEGAYELGARFDGWSDTFTLAFWETAFRDAGLDLETVATGEIAFEEPLPWSHIDCGIDPLWLRAEYEKALAAVETPDCRFGECGDCGVCGGGVGLELAERQRR